MTDAESLRDREWRQERMPSESLISVTGQETEKWDHTWQSEDWAIWPSQNGVVTNLTTRRRAPRRPDWLRDESGSDSEEEDHRDILLDDLMEYKDEGLRKEEPGRLSQGTVKAATTPQRPTLRNLQWQAAEQGKKCDRTLKNDEDNNLEGDNDDGSQDQKDLSMGETESAYVATASSVLISRDILEQTLNEPLMCGDTEIRHIMRVDDQVDVERVKNIHFDFAFTSANKYLERQQNEEERSASYPHELDKHWYEVSACANRQKPSLDDVKINGAVSLAAAQSFGSIKDALPEDCNTLPEACIPKVDPYEESKRAFEEEMRKVFLKYRYHESKEMTLPYVPVATTKGMMIGTPWKGKKTTGRTTEAAMKETAAGSKERRREQETTKHLPEPRTLIVKAGGNQKKVVKQDRDLLEKRRLIIRIYPAKEAITWVVEVGRTGTGDKVFYTYPTAEVQRIKSSYESGKRWHKQQRPTQGEEMDRWLNLHESFQVWGKVKTTHSFSLIQG